MKRRDFLKMSALGTGLLLAPRWALASRKLGSTSTGLPEPIKGAESFVVMPDTQFYAEKYPALFHAQTKWIVENRDKYNIRFVLHVGDVTDNNNKKEWDIAKAAFSRLDGHLPYAICLGNHDLGNSGKADSRDSMFKDYFPLDFWKKQKTFGGIYDKQEDRPDNSYHLFSSSGIDWLVLALEFGPRDDVLRWAGEVAGDHPQRKVILLTHAYLTPEGVRYDSAKYPKQSASPHSYPVNKLAGGCNDGEQMWKGLVSKHKNFQMVFCGHTSVVSRLASRGSNGNTVHQYLADYQFCDNGGDTWMRLVQITPNERKIHTTDFSPKLGQLSNDQDATFTMDM